MKHTILNRCTKEVIFEAEAEDMKATVERAVREEVPLVLADLRGLDLAFADLRGACLCGAELSHSNLMGADLRGADLSCAWFHHADLVRADLRGARINWQDRHLMSAILCDAAGADGRKLAVAGLFLIRQACWRQILGVGPELRAWMKETLAAYVQPGDSAPLSLRRIAESKGDTMDPVDLRVITRAPAGARA